MQSYLNCSVTKKKRLLVYFVLIFKKKFRMSHIQERKEKDCLNCGTIVQGRYCQNCGQENVVPHETFWHMVKHFVFDILHFDSKFYDSMKLLLFKPGFLPKEYIKGRRARYMNPVKKYVFTSAIFFILFFSFFAEGGGLNLNVDEPISQKDRVANIKKAEKILQENPGDSLWAPLYQKLLDSSVVVTEKDLLPISDNFTFIGLGGRRYASLKEYDSVQKNLPGKEKDSWFRKVLQRQNLKVSDKFKHDPRGISDKLTSVFLHNLPYLLFISLPIFSLFLKLLYFRKKELYYVDHGIFTIYHYIFTFILLLFVFSANKLANITHANGLNILTIFLVLSGGVYLYLSMKRFYEQSHLRTAIKFLLLNVLGLVMLLALFFSFVIFSIFKM